MNESMTSMVFSVLMKLFWIVLAFAGSFFEPITSFLGITLLLVFADLFTGIWAAKKRKEKIDSKGMRKSTSKIIAYFLAIVLSRSMELVFFDGTWVEEHIPITYMVSGFISAVEFQSNIENIGEITGIDIWSQLKKKLSTLLKINKDETK